MKIILTATILFFISFVKISWAQNPQMMQQMEMQRRAAEEGMRQAKEQSEREAHRNEELVKQAEENAKEKIAELEKVE